MTRTASIGGRQILRLFAILTGILRRDVTDFTGNNDSVVVSGEHQIIAALCVARRGMTIGDTEILWGDADHPVPFRPEVTEGFGHEDHRPDQTQIVRTRPARSASKRK